MAAHDNPRTPNPSWKFTFTDTGNAERLVAAHGHKFRYVHDWKTWLYWDGQRWVKDVTNEIGRSAKATIRDAYSQLSTVRDDSKRRELARFLAKSESRRAKDAMVALATKEPRVCALSNQFDASPMLLNVKNGTFDLETMQLKEHRPEQMLTKLCPVTYDPCAKCDRWRTFLAELFQDRPELIAFLQRSIGYSLTGLIAEQCFWLLIGLGKNGKSTFLGTIAFLLGDYAIETSFNTFAFRSDSRAINPRDGLASLMGSRFVRASESDEERRISEALLKTLTGGERIRSARMYEQDFDYLPTFKIWLSSNYEPSIRGTDEGIWRRIHRVNFDRVIEESKRDPQLAETLRLEAPGILNWALEGLKQYRANGLEVPDSVRTATKDYRTTQNRVLLFLESVKDSGCETEATILYEDFRDWCEEEGLSPIPSQTAFGKEAKKHLASRRNNTGRFVYVGVKTSRQPGEGVQEGSEESEGLLSNSL